jgi:chromosomal replication initiation ATPase DnaA
MAKGGVRELSGKKELRAHIAFNDVLQAVEEVKGEKIEEFGKRRGDWGKPLVLLLARKYCGLILKEIGSAIGGIDYAAVAMNIKRFQEKCKKSGDLSRLSTQATNALLNVKT